MEQSSIGKGQYGEKSDERRGLRKQTDAKRHENQCEGDFLLFLLSYKTIKE